MDTSPLMVLDNQPLPEDSTTVTLDIYSQPRDESGLIYGIETLTEKHGKITIPQHWRIFALQQNDQQFAQLQFPQEAVDLYLVDIPFTLHEAIEGQYYKKVTFLVELADEKALALDLFPKHVLALIEITRSYKISPQLRFQEVEASLGEKEQQFQFTSLRPEITAFGEGDHTFYWIYQSTEMQKEVIPETKRALLLLQVPHGTQEVAGTLSYRLDIAKKRSGFWTTKESRVDESPFLWQLRNALPLALPRREASQRRVAQEGPSIQTSAPSVDVCVICALPKEARAFMRTGEQRTGQQFAPGLSQDKREYYLTTMLNNQGEELTLQVSCLPAYGPLEVGLHTQSFLKEFRPRFALMTGICAGDRNHVQLGDLIVAERAFPIDTGKFTLLPDGSQKHLTDVSTYHADTNLLQYARLFEDWEQEVAKLVRPASMQRAAQCHVVPLASSNAVRSDRPFRHIQTVVRGAFAIDMEGAGFYRTVANFPGTSALVVKGISDYADEEKDDSYHEYASLASATYALTFIQRYVPASRRPESGV